MKINIFSYKFAAVYFSIALSPYFETPLLCIASIFLCPIISLHDVFLRTGGVNHKAWMPESNQTHWIPLENEGGHIFTF